MQAPERVAERELTAGSVLTAGTRRWLAETAACFGLGEAASDDLALVAGELLANAFLHASGPYRVSLELRSGSVRVSVRDGSRALPVPKELDPCSATGRGLRVVRAVAASWGTELTAEGKTVWADLPATGRSEGARAPWCAPGAGGGRGGAAKPAMSGGTEHCAAAPAPPRDAAVARPPERPQRASRDHLVWYLGVPAGEFLAMRAGVEAMLREATLISLRATQPGLPEPLSELAQRATTGLPAARMAACAPLNEVAVDEETGTGDFTVAVPKEAADQLQGFDEVVRGFNEWCESGYLLVAPLTPALLELHSWATKEALRQLRLGAEPRPFLPATGRAGR
ncbi:MAG TPA: ATP-binding protein [Acidimicrobiales bacterium]|nr:ATP-binding protein [Acidimicrobiales bacterium]